jgi:hypothetical protein
VQVQALNARATERYGEFVGAIDTVTEMFAPLEKLINRMSERRVPPGSWRIARPEELKKMLAKARKDLEELKAHAKKYEAELKSREWRV